MNWIFLFKTVMILLLIYVLTYFNLAWVGLILVAIIMWSQNDDLISISGLYREEKEKTKRLEEIIEKLKIG